MRSGVVLADTPDFSVHAVACRDDHAAWSEPEPARGHGLVLVRRGRFRRRVAGDAVLADPTMGYLSTPGTTERFAHPVGGDECTSIRISPRLWRGLSGADAAPAAAGVYVDARVDLAHRLLLRAVRSGDLGYAGTERLLGLVAGAIGATPVRTRGRDRRVADAARQAIQAGDPASDGLLPLAASLGVSPHRLSRVFRREVGIPVTRFRNRVRVGVAVERIEGGEPSLAALSADLAFADQSHLTRTMRTHLGYTPAALRRLLLADAH